MKVFGKRMRELRKRKNMTQQDLADLMHITKPTISNWENEKTEPSQEETLKIAEVLGTTTGYLFGETDRPNPTIALVNEWQDKDITGQYFFRFDTNELNEQEKEEFEEQLEDMASFLVNSIKKRRDKK